MNARGLALPVLLGGAALTRAYVEEDLRALYGGEVHYARDAFEGLRLMDAVTAVARGEAPPADPRAGKSVRRRLPRVEPTSAEAASGRSDVATDVEVPRPPFLGDRVVRGIALGDVAAMLDERATFLGQWGLRPTRGGDGPGYEELVEVEGRPRLRMWLDRIAAEKIVTPAVVYGYFPCVSKGDDLIVYHGDGSERRERTRFTFPRQRRDRRLCLADFFRPEESGELDVVAFHVVTMGSRVSEVTADLFGRDAYRDYLELHGLSVQLTEALAEYWHARVRQELGIDGADPEQLGGFLESQYRGCRYSFGYPACPDLEDQLKVVELLAPERIGVTLSEEFQLDPEQSTSALITHHPEASYFNAR
jgi:5-methyltetrahydrofolate--homocysteine methyltransferase